MLAQLEATVDGSTQVIPVLKPISIIGKKSACDIVIPHPSVSSQHAKLIVTYNGVTIEDLNSTNGTKVRGERIGAPTALQNGDTIQMGGVLVKLVLPTNELAQPDRPAASPPPLRRPTAPSAAQPPEILKVLGDEIPIKDRIRLLNKEFSKKVFIPSVHWRVRFFLHFAAGMCACAVVLFLFYLGLAGTRIDPRLLSLLRQFAAENSQTLAAGGSGRYTARSLRLSQNPDIIGYFVMDREGRELFPNPEQKIPIENAAFNPHTFSGPGMLRGPTGTWYLIEAISLDAEQAGFACMQLDRRPSSRIGAVSVSLVVVVLFFLMVLGYIFITVAGNIVTTPLSTLIIEIDELRMGQRHELSTFEYFPEVDRLARGAELLQRKER